MKNSLYATLLTGDPHDACLVDAWLDERIASSASIDLPSEITATRQDNSRLAKAVTADEYDGNIAPGQIRILSKRFTADPDVIPYVAVLEEWHKGMWLVAPFSQYSYPATPGEMTTGIRHLGLRVIQAWNARTMQESLLAKSYLFGDLPDSVLKDGLSLFRHEMGGVALPDDFHALRGGAITMECDPRREYLAETIARLRPLSTAVKATERALADRQVAIDESIRAHPFWWRSAVAYAAGSTPPVTQKCKVHESELWLTHDPEQKKVLMAFYDSEGEPTHEYDGCAVLGRGVEFLGTFLDGTLSVPDDAVLESFKLTDPDGCPIEVCKIEES